MPENKPKRILKLPAIILLGSFTLLALVSALFNPKEDIAIIPLFFLLIWTIIFSFMWLALGLIKKGAGPKAKSWIGLIATFAVLFLMLKSTGEVRPVDLLVLLLLASGLSLYLNRRL